MYRTISLKPNAFARIDSAARRYGLSKGELVDEAVKSLQKHRPVPTQNQAKTSKAWQQLEAKLQQIKEAYRGKTSPLDNLDYSRLEMGDAYTMEDFKI